MPILRKRNWLATELNDYSPLLLLVRATKCGFGNGAVGGIGGQGAVVSDYDYAFPVRVTI